MAHVQREAATTLTNQQAVASRYRRHQAGVLLATSGSYIAYYIIRLVFTTEQVQLMADYGFDLGQIGLILSTFGIGYGTAKIFMGALVDRMNAKYFLAGGLYLSASLNALIAFTQDFGLILGLMLLIAVTQAMGAPACQRQIALWFSKRHRGAAFSIWAAAHNAGAFLCVAVIQLAGWCFAGSLPAVFLLSSLVSAVLATLMLVINTDRPASVGLPAIADYTGQREVDAQGQSLTTEVTTASLFTIFLQHILRNRVVWLVTLTSMSLYIVRYGVLSWIPSYLPTKGFSTSWAQWFVGVFELSAVPGVIAMGFLSDYLDGRRALLCLLATLLLFGCLLTYFTTNNRLLLTGVLFLMGTVIYAPLSLVGLMVNEAVPNYALGLSTGFMGFFQYIFGETLATALIGGLVQAYGWTLSAWVIYFATVTAILLLTSLVWQERQVRRLAAESDLVSAIR
ncbi:MFS transporter [Leuconostocaceae bacterium ESL0958]|nr:MFS transporter [Leuconostocaceae bacterium ESL0958]